MEHIEEWVRGTIPEDWFTAPVEVSVDREEVLIAGTLDGAEGSSPVAAFRESTRRERMRIADAIEERYGHKTAWAVDHGGERIVFTSLSVPVMTRLRQPERLVLDTLVEAGVARSRSDALAWCVRLVGEHEGEWLGKLRDALGAVRSVRDERAAR